VTESKKNAEDAGVGRRVGVLDIANLEIHLIAHLHLSSARFDQEE